MSNEPHMYGHSSGYGPDHRFSSATSAHDPRSGLNGDVPFTAHNDQFSNSYPDPSVVDFGIAVVSGAFGALFGGVGAVYTCRWIDNRNNRYGVRYEEPEEEKLLDVKVLYPNEYHTYPKKRKKKRRPGM